MTKQNYQSDIVLGRKYRDRITGLEGTATSLHFYMNACERVVLSYAHDGDAKEFSADSVDLIDLETAQPARSERRGGPARSMPPRR